MARPLGTLERSLAALTINVHNSGRQRTRALVDTTVGEYEQQVHVPLSGSATPTWAFVDKPVNWEMPFLFAPDQRRVPFATPHHTYGVEFLTPPIEHVVIHVQVVGWNVSQEGWFTGATVRCSSAAPDTVTSGVAYNAVAHLTFQGYAVPAEGNEFQ